MLFRSIETGLTPINDRINRISDRVEEIEQKQKVLEDENALSDINIKALSETVKDEEKVINENMDVNSIFSKFDI